MVVMNPIQAVFFDVDETVFTVTPSVLHHYREVLSGFDIKVDDAALAKALSDSWKEIKPYYENAQNSYRTFPTRERELWREYSRRVVQKINQEPDLNILDSLYERFSKGESRSLRDGFRELIEALRKKDIVVGLFTNNDGRIRNVVREHQLSDLLDHVFSAEDVGFKKPSPYAFRQIESITKIFGSHNLYVGNSIEHDYRGPVDAGWQAVILAASETLHTEAASLGIPAIRSFREFEKLFS